jgi:hypothetical protein
MIGDNFINLLSIKALFGLDLRIKSIGLFLEFLDGDLLE